MSLGRCPGLSWGGLLPISVLSWPVQPFCAFGCLARLESFSFQRTKLAGPPQELGGERKLASEWAAWPCPLPPRALGTLQGLDSTSVSSLVSLQPRHPCVRSDLCQMRSGHSCLYRACCLQAQMEGVGCLCQGSLIGRGCLMSCPHPHPLPGLLRKSAVID